MAVGLRLRRGGRIHSALLHLHLQDGFLGELSQLFVASLHAFREAVLDGDCRAPVPVARLLTLGRGARLVALQPIFEHRCHVFFEFVDAAIQSLLQALSDSVHRLHLGLARLQMTRHHSLENMAFRMVVDDSKGVPAQIEPFRRLL